MLSFLKTAIDGTDPTVDERRLSLVVALFLIVLVVLATGGIGYVVAFTAKDQNPFSVNAMHQLIYVIALLCLFACLMSGIVTWQNINDTLKSVQNLPPGTMQTIEKIETHIQSQAPITP